jgi:tetratricopeptide (TPR) repeat protein
MKLKQPIVIVAALALSWGVKAESLEQGIKMYNYERYESAKKELAPIAATNPIANYYLGLAELRLGHIDEAKNIFAKYPDNYANMSGIARVSFMQGNATQGTQLAAALAARAKKKEWEQLKYAADAITYTKGGDIQQAIGWYKTAIANANNNNVDMLISLGDAYLQVPGNSGGGEAMSSFDKAVEKDPKNSLAYSRIAKVWYEAKNYTLALENWEKAKNADLTNPLPYCDLADAYSYTGNYAKSKENLEKCLELSDKSAEDIRKYTDVLFLNKDYQQAAEKAQDLIQKGATNPGVFGILGASQYELKDAANKYGLDNYRRYIINQDPAKVTPADYRTFAKILLKNNMGEEANNFLNKAIEMDKSANKSDAYRQTAEALREAREWKLAGDWYKKLTLEYPADAKAIDYFYWGVCNYYIHNFTEAGTAFGQMETKFPAEPSATYWRGRTAAAIDSDAKEGTAIPFYDKWLQMPTEKKPGDLKQVWEYEVIYYYNKEDSENLKKAMGELEKVDPSDALLKQIRDILSKPKGTIKEKTKTKTR